MQRPRLKLQHIVDMMSYLVALVTEGAVGKVDLYI